MNEQQQIDLIKYQMIADEIRYLKGQAWTILIECVTLLGAILWFKEELNKFINTHTCICNICIWNGILKTIIILFVLGNISLFYTLLSKFKERIDMYRKNQRRIVRILAGCNRNEICAIDDCEVINPYIGRTNIYIDCLLCNA